MNHRKLLALVGILGLSLAACAAQVDEPEAAAAAEDVDTAEQAIGVGCDPNAPPCACLLKGTTACTDPDGDGIFNLDDNCDYAYNPNQADCDGDHTGDACDSFSGTQTTTTSWTATTSTVTASTPSYCWVNGLYLPEYQVYRLVDVTTTSYCAGPQAGQTVSTTSNERYQAAGSPVCYKYSGYCDGNTIPTPYMSAPPGTICY